MAKPTPKELVNNAYNLAATNSQTKLINKAITIELALFLQKLTPTVQSIYTKSIAPELVVFAAEFDLYPIDIEKGYDTVVWSTQDVEELDILKNGKDVINYIFGMLLAAFLNNLSETTLDDEDDFDTPFFLQLSVRELFAGEKTLVLDLVIESDGTFFNEKSLETFYQKHPIYSKCAYSHFLVSKNRFCLGSVSEIVGNNCKNLDAVMKEISKRGFCVVEASGGRHG